MPKGAEGIPLRLLKRRDGVLLLRNAVMQTSPSEATEPLVFPAMHEFSMDWLMEHTADGTVKMTDTHIQMLLGNGVAVYKIRRDLMEMEDGRKLSTGYWGELTDASYNEPPELDMSVYEEAEPQAEEDGSHG